MRRWRLQLLRTCINVLSGGWNPQNNRDTEELEIQQHIQVPEICEIEDSDIESLFIQGMGGVIFKVKFLGAEWVLPWYPLGNLSRLSHDPTVRILEREKGERECLGERRERKSIRAVQNTFGRLGSCLGTKWQYPLGTQKIFIFKEAIKDAQSKIAGLTKKYLYECENRVSLLELKALEREEELRLLIEEKERQKQEVHFLVVSLEEKEKLTVELSAALVKEKEQFDLIKSKLELALEQIEVDKGEMDKLDQKVELMTNEHTNMLRVITEKESDRLLLEAKENEQRKQMQALIVLVCGLSRQLSDFECRVAKRIRNCHMRLEDSNSELSSLVRKTNSLKNTALMYKNRLEKRCNDLQMAESEVDLLGDQVDALLSLLEKIYIALDHYSPIFKHYPGVIEILELVKRELIKKPTKSI